MREYRVQRQKDQAGIFPAILQELVYFRSVLEKLLFLPVKPCIS
jgi:hypothetical protein